MNEISLKESDSPVDGNSTESGIEGNSVIEISVDNSSLSFIPHHLSRLQKRLEKQLVPEKFYEHHEIYAKEIKSSWSKCVEGIIETGYLLSEAKTKLSKNDYKRFRTTINFSTRTINRLLKINEDNRIKTHVSHLPPSWGTLYELTTLDDKTFQVAVKEKKIHPEMKRSDVSKLKKTPVTSGEEEHEPSKQNFDGSIKACVVYVDEKMMSSLDDILDKIKNINGIQLDESPFDRYQKKQQDQFSRDLKSAQRKGRRIALQVILDYRKEKIKKDNKENYLKGNTEIEELLKEQRIRDLVNNPYSPGGINLIDRVLSSIGHDRRCEYYVNKELYG